MKCRKDYSSYFTKGFAKKALASCTLLVTMGCGFGHAMGEIPAGVHLEHFDGDKKDSVLVRMQWMNGVPLCSKSIFTIVSDRKKSDTAPPEILNTLHDSGIYNTSAPQFSKVDIGRFVAVFDAQARVAGKRARMFLSRDGCRHDQSYFMPVKFKTPEVRAKRSVRRETKTQEAHAKMVCSLEALAEEKTQVAIYLLTLREVAVVPLCTCLGFVGWLWANAAASRCQGQT